MSTAYQLGYGLDLFRQRMRLGERLDDDPTNQRYELDGLLGLLFSRGVTVPLQRVAGLTHRPHGDLVTDDRQQWRRDADGVTQFDPPLQVVRDGESLVTITSWRVSDDHRLAWVGVDGTEWRIRIA